MASNFDENKYKKIFESRYGAGSFDVGLSNARSIGATKAKADFEKQDYQRRLKEYQKAQKEASKQSLWSDNLENNTLIKRDGSTLTLDDMRSQGAYRVGEEIRNDPYLQAQVKEKGFSVSEYINSLYDKLSNGQFRSEREYKEFSKSLQKEANKKPTTADLIAQYSNEPAEKKGFDALKKNDSKPQKGFLGKVGDFLTSKDVDGDGERDGMLGLADRFLAPISKGATEFIAPGNAERMAQNAPDNPVVKAAQKDRGLETKILNTGGLLAAAIAPYGQAYKLANHALNKVPAFSKIANPYGQKAITGGLAGGIAEGGISAVNEMVNSEAYDMKDHAIRTGIGLTAGAVLDPAMHGIYNLIKGARAAKNVRPQTEELLALPAPKETPIPAPAKPLGLPEPQLQLPGPRVKPNSETFNNAFKQPNGLSSPIPQMPDVMRIAAKRGEFEQAGVNFAQSGKHTPKSRPDLTPIETPIDHLSRGQVYWQGRYEEFARHVNDNYDMNRMTPEALEDLWSQFARYDEPIRLEQAVDLAYPKGFESPPAPKPEPIPEPPKRTIKDDLREDPLVNEKIKALFPPKKPEPKISRLATLDEMFKHAEDLAPPKQPEPSFDALRFSRPQDSLVKQFSQSQKTIPKGWNKADIKNTPVMSGKTTKGFEAISASKAKEPKIIRGTPVDRTPIDINNPKEIVKQQIDTTGKREKSKWSFDKVYTALVSDLHAVNKATKDLGGKGIKIENDPHKLAQLARGVAGKAETYLNGGVFNEQGQKVAKSLKEIIKPIENKIDDFLAYTTSKRALDYDQKGLTAGIKPKNVEGMNDYQLAEAAIRQLEAESPAFKEHQKELVKYSQTLMKELKESGYYTDDAIEQIFKDNPNYIPMNRVQEPRVRGFEPISPKKKFASLTNPVKQRTGSEKPIINPVESLVKNTYVITNIAERNKVGVALHDLIKSAPKDNMWGRITNVTKQDSSIDNLSSVLDDATIQMTDGRTDAIDNLFKGEGNKVYVYKDGQKIEMELQEDLYKAMLSLDAQKQNVFLNVMGIPARSLRAGAVLSPDFGPVNIFRDQLSAFVNSKYGFIPFVDMAKGMKSVLKKDSDYWLWKQSGGANSVLSTLDREYLQQDLRKMIKQTAWQKTKNVARSPIKSALEPLRKLSEITEESTRVGEFKKGLKKGATPKEAAFSSRDLIDFSRAGNIGRQYNQVTAFFNAAVQSMDKLARTFKEHPVKAPVKAITSITLPSVVAYYYNHDQEWYREIPQRERDLFWHFKAGDQIYKLPKPFEAGVMFGTSFERLLDSMKTNDPKAFEGFGKTVREAFTPNWIPTAFLPWIEVFGNKSIHFDSPIVPRREQDMLPEDQFGPYQSEISKKFGAIAKKSPRKAEHVFKGYTGGLGNYALKLTDLGAKLGGVERPEMPDRGIADMPVLNRFVVKNLDGNNQSVNDFYKRMEKLRRENLSAKKHNPDHENSETYQTINKLSKEISELQAAKRAVIDDPNMSGKEKTEVIKRIDQAITQIAKAGNRIP
ncbi:LPD38 domain-containing protein [Bacillus sp. DTU_2020_1000418_1_SI_GHA_SEK_038]|uniref:LPD38 domain-containing protein n=1 Tax=Bacillus sp. DTU_2020_1000418_1_SI_GHA_SEK_038 TaxID=3077585 RepID=UPI0028EDCA44|nr:LPD38 domain-containing protein [Bacillus sp. DTU_2020_1000418_1_SI_GHA_SEK_038]WNS74230.1 LPD38 domain-containing protein [Bacillus sp. DTU_2020_1000418_1_SI_GHA_SEK_038]